MGRKRGSKNRFTVSMKEAFHQAFDELGGVPALTKWAMDNQTDFYKLCARLFPMNLQATVNVRAEDLDDDVLLGIATGSGGRVIEAQAGTKKPN